MHNKQAHKTLSSGVPKMIIRRNLHMEDSVQRPGTVGKRKVYMDQFVQVGLKL